MKIRTEFQKNFLFPGGINTLKGLSNKSMDTQFNQVEHSNAAKYLLNDYLVKSNGKIVNQNGNIPTDRHNFKADESLEVKTCQSVWIFHKLIFFFFQHLVDWDKAMLSQISKLEDKYEEWVNLPVDRNLRLFESTLLESLSKCPWYAVPIFWTPIILYLFITETPKISDSIVSFLKIFN